jgi:hypothetical protein
MSDHVNLPANSVVPVSGRYQCDGCGGGALAKAFANLAGPAGAFAAMQQSKPQTVRDFKKGDTFPCCPNCTIPGLPGSLTGWTLVHETPESGTQTSHTAIPAPDHGSDQGQSRQTNTEHPKPSTKVGNTQVLYDTVKDGDLVKIKHIFEAESIDINTRFHERQATLLHAAAQSGSLEVVQYLVEKGANVRATDANGWMAFHEAVDCGHLIIVRYFVEKKGVNVNTKTISGATALHWMAARGNSDMLTYLLSRGADASARTDSPLGSFSVSDVAKNRAIAESLKRKGNPGGINMPPQGTPITQGWTVSDVVKPKWWQFWKK